MSNEIGKLLKGMREGVDVLDDVICQLGLDGTGNQHHSWRNNPGDVRWLIRYTAEASVQVLQGVIAAQHAVARFVSGANEPNEDDGQLSLFDVEPCEKRYVDAPSWPPEPA
jgi:hypothetical protein